MGGGAAAAQAILLCKKLFGTAVPEKLEPILTRDKKTRKLMRVALWAAAPSKVEKTPADYLFGGLRVNYSHRLLSSGGRYWFAEIKCNIVSPADIELLQLPSRLHFLYPLLRFPLWVFRHLIARIRSGLTFCAGRQG